MTVNILTPNERCHRYCARRLKADPGNRGDVRCCEHSRYWLWRPCRVSLDGHWERLSWHSHPIELHRARRAFAALKPETSS